MKKVKIPFDKSHDDQNLKKELSKLVEEKEYLENLVSFNSLRFKDVLIYCKKTMDAQDDLIRRLEDSIERNHSDYENKLKSQYSQIETEEKEFKSEIEKLQTDNWLMKTQLETREDQDQGMQALRARIVELEQVIEEKDDVISKAELKEREIPKHIYTYTVKKE